MFSPDSPKIEPENNPNRLINTIFDYFDRFEIESECVRDSPSRWIATKPDPMLTPLVFLDKSFQCFSLSPLSSIHIPDTALSLWRVVSNSGCVSYTPERRQSLSIVYSLGRRRRAIIPTQQNRLEKQSSSFSIILLDERSLERYDSF